MSVDAIRNVSFISGGIDATTYEVAVISVEGYEHVSQLFSFTITLRTDSRDAITVAKTLNAPATLTFTTDAGVVSRQIYGMISEISAPVGAGGLTGDANQAGYTCTLTMVPRAWALTLTKKTQVFVGLSVFAKGSDQSIIESKLQAVFQTAKASGGSGLDYNIANLNASNYPARELVVQYNESDYDFICRWAEHLGVSFYFDHSSGKDVIVFVDSSSQFQAISEPQSIDFRGSVTGVDIGLLQMSNQVKSIPNQFQTNDYDSANPHDPATSSAPYMAGPKLCSDSFKGLQPSGAIYEYGPNIDVGSTTAGSGTPYAATIRMNEAISTMNIFSGSSDVAAASPGFTIQLTDSTIISWNGLSSSSAIIFTKVAHHFFANSDEGFTGPWYTNEFEAIPGDSTYRPLRRTPMPKVPGVIQAKIEATEATAYAQLDSRGRYLVRWFADWTDPKPAAGKASNLITMLQPHGGPNYGVHFPLRAGTIVMLVCIEGDPDRPLIVGVAPDVNTPGPVTSTNATRNVIKTGGAPQNEPGGGGQLNFDDTTNAYRATLYSPSYHTQLQLGSPETSDKNLLKLQEQGALLRSDEAVSVGAQTTFSGIAQQVLSFAGTFLSSLSTQAFHIVSKTVTQTVTDLLNRTSAQQQDSQLVSAVAQNDATTANNNATSTTQGLWNDAQNVVQAAQISGMSAASFGNPEQLLIVLADQVAAFVASNGSDGNAFVTAQQILSMYGKSAAQMTSDQAVVLSSKNTLNAFAANAVTLQSGGTFSNTSAQAAKYVSQDTTAFTSTNDFTVTSSSGNIALSATSAGIKGNATTVAWNGTQSVTAGTSAAQLALSTSSGTLSTGPASVQTSASGVTVSGGPQAQVSAATVSISGDSSVSITGASVSISGMVSLG